MPRMTMKRLVAAVAYLTTVSSSALAGTINVVDAWAPSLDDTSRPGSVFVTIANPGAADELTRIETPVALLAQIHSIKNDEGAERMKRTKRLPIPADAEVVLRGEDFHVMLVKVKKALTAGETFPMTFVFANAGRIDAVVAVKAQDMPGMGSASHGH